MQKEVGKRVVSTVAFSEIFLLIFATIAIAFIVGQGLGTVSAAPIVTEKPPTYSGDAANLAAVKSPGTTTPNPTQTGDKVVTLKATTAGNGLANVPVKNIGGDVGGTPIANVVKGRDGTLSYVDKEGNVLAPMSDTERLAYIKAGNAGLAKNTGELASNGYTTTAVKLPDGTTTQAYVNPTADPNNAYIAKPDGSVAGGSIKEGVFSETGAAAAPAEKQFSVLGTPIASGGVAYLLEGAMYAGVVYGVIQMAGSLFGLKKSLTNALSYAAVGGIMTWKVLQSLGPKGFGMAGQNSFLVKNSPYIGIGVAILIFLLTYKTTKIKVVTFTCLPYQPPIGGANCEKCNNDPFRPCSEYRCRALGQACQLLNQGTGSEQCAWVNPKDVTSPTIVPWDAALSPSGLKYTPDNAIRPPHRGVKIVNTKASDGCLQAFTPLQFGITTNEPSQCKIDYGNYINASFSTMQFFFGESSLYGYNHTQVMRLPGPDNESNTGSPLLRNDGTYSLFVRCQDANGNVNVDSYVFDFCVAKGPDTTPPLIEGTSLDQNAPIRFNSDTTPIQVYVNEPSQCKWSNKDKAYADMENNMTCSTETYQINSDLLYTCSGTLNQITNKVGNTIVANDYYFRCKDQPNAPEKDRNVNSQSYHLSLRGSEPLKILSVDPNGTISDSTTTTTVNLQVETSAGADDGKAACYFSTSTVSDSFVQMVETNANIHKQPLNLGSGNYRYNIRCIDAAGNVAESNTTFNVQIDKQAPIVTRVYKEDPDSLKIVTDETSTCTYSLSSCNFNSNEGLVTTSQDNLHYISAKPKTTYYVKCVDQYGNEPSPDSCSIVVNLNKLTQTTRPVSTA